MKILVTGGNGFIGQNLCLNLLESGHEVVCMDNFMTSKRSNLDALRKFDNFEFIYRDVCEPFEIECDRIYHLACPASPVQYQKNPVQTIKTAFIGTLNALKCARNCNARMVITSTSEIYGDPLVDVQPETYFGNVNPIGKRSSYDEGKRAGESLAYSWRLQFKTDVRIARLFNCYGPMLNFDDGRLISNVIVRCIDEKPITINGSGNQTRSFCYVDDTVNGLISIIEQPQVQGDNIPVYNIGNPDERTILSVVNYIRQCFGNKVELIHNPIPEDDPKRRCPDITLAREKLGWSPKVSFEAGIERTINWFKTNYQKTP